MGVVELFFILAFSDFFFFFSQLGERSEFISGYSSAAQSYLLLLKLYLLCLSSVFCGITHKKKTGLTLKQLHRDELMTAPMSKSALLPQQPVKSHHSEAELQDLDLSKLLLHTLTEMGKLWDACSV